MSWATSRMPRTPDLDRALVPHEPHRTCAQRLDPARTLPKRRLEEVQNKLDPGRAAKFGLVRAFCGAHEITEPGPRSSILCHTVIGASSAAWDPGSNVLGIDPLMKGVD